MGSSVVSASLAGASLSDTAGVNFVAGPAAGLTIANAASNGQSATVGGVVANAPSVRLADANGNGIANATVTFAVASGGGSITDGVRTTDGAGVATVGSWRVGPSTGTNTLTATAGSFVMTFTATAVAGAPGSVVLSGGDGQTAMAGTTVPIAPAVKVTDASGNPVSGTTVNFFVESGGGSLTGATATTNASGIASAGSWKLGNVAGPNTLTAGAVGLSGTVTFSATGLTGPAALIAIANAASNNQSAQAGTAVAIPPSVKVTDAVGNAVAGASVTFAVASGGGSITGTGATTNASGIATLGSWTLGSSAGSNTVSATLAGVAGATVTFTATATPIPPLVIAITGGVERGQTVSLSFTQSGASIPASAVTLTLSPADAGSVNSDGTVKLLKTGSLTMTATSSGATGSTTVTVTQPPLFVFDLLRDGVRHIWQAAIDGGDLVQLTQNGSDNQHGSRVGDRLAYAGARNGANFEIFSMIVSTGTETNLTNNAFADRDPNLSPDGQRIVYVSAQTGLDRARYMNVDGTNNGPVADNTANAGAIEISPAWSPASDIVIFSSTAGSSADLWIATTLGGVATKLPAPANSTDTEIGPVWNAAGQIAFHTTRSGGDEIWITNTAGSSATKLTDGASPSWTTDGRVVFVRYTGATGSLYWVDPANPGVVHPISVGGGNAQRPSVIRP
jgi:Tol biopolymer transport system component